MATISEILKSFCYRINQPAPTAFVGVSSPTEQQYLELFRFVGDNLRNRSYQWPQLKRGYTFLTSTGVSRYALPGDFYRLLRSTEWDVTNSRSMLGPVSDHRFTANQYTILDTMTQRMYRIIGPTAHLISTSPYSKRSSGTIEIEQPGANNTDELYYMYLSCNWIWPRDWVASTVYVANDIRSVNGYVYICKTGGTSGTTRPTTGTADTDITDNTVTWRVYTEPYEARPGNAALNDNDLCLFDEDLMIDGISWKYKQMKGLDFQQERQDWENAVKSCYARFEGSTTVNMIDSFAENDSWITVPTGSWNV